MRGQGQEVCYWALGKTAWQLLTMPKLLSRPPTLAQRRPLDAQTEPPQLLKNPWVSSMMPISVNLQRFVVGISRTGGILKTSKGPLNRRQGSMDPYKLMVTITWVLWSMGQLRVKVPHISSQAMTPFHPIADHNCPRYSIHIWYSINLNNLNNLKATSWILGCSSQLLLIRYSSHIIYIY